MSLRPDDRKGRSRSKSPGRSRDRSRSHVRAPSPGPQYYEYGSAEHGYEGAAATPQYEVRQPGYPPAGEPITMGGFTDLPPEQRPGYMQQAQAAASYQYSARTNPTSPTGVTYAPAGVQYTQTGGQYGYTQAPANQGGPPRNPSGAFHYAQAPEKITFTSKPVVNTTQPPNVRHSAQPTSPPPAHQQYPTYTAQPQSQQQQQQQQQYPPPPASSAAQAAYPPPPMGRHSPQPGHHRAASHSAAPAPYDGHNIVEMVPQGGGKLNAPPSPGLRPHSHSVSGGRPEGLGLTPRMDRLSVSGNRPDIQTIVPGGMPGGFPGGGLPPPSPLLEAYHGTYQSISPMPQAMMLNDDLDHIPSLDGGLSPRDSRSSIHSSHLRAHSSSRRSPSRERRSKPKDKLALEAHGRTRDDRDRDRDRDRGRDRDRPSKEKRRVKIYDAEEDATALVEAMSHRTPDVDPLIDILPALTHDQMLELRAEYKRHCKVQGRGINIAKHIKMKTSGNFGKIAYVTALGKYESEGYWANYWYQSNSARRELLIEALMGRSNFEIREIKDAFRDKRYSDSLTRCMDKELKADKFRKAILMALDAERQEESDVWPVEYRNRDVDTLYKALKAREGGESAMLSIVVMRSDAHLREVLRTYERKYQGSFARDALRKSNNLGEIIAHILNGVINRPARDAMLLHHALMDLIDTDTPPRGSSSKLSSSSSSKHERQQRFELLISRLVRLHWERMHMMRVKTEYQEKYGHLLEEDVEEATKGDFSEFCLALCQTGR
ncbi:Annexin [Corynespora cassiicola Philippines]|uniref:Annexin n=1 Tax=Corynespora cassiicola Philippines TaxID=1448308 RepID=A0A2T2NYP8_CORCC|nr:Annexin [Corynespora cassiicola Philippines]